MSITLVHVYHEDDNPGNIGVQAALPLHDPRYCIEIMQLLDKVKSDTIKKLAEANQNNMQHERGFLHKMLQMLGKRMPEEERKKLGEQLSKMEQAEKTGQGIQTTLNNLAKALQTASIEDKDRMIKDIIASIENIVRGA